MSKLNNFIQEFKDKINDIGNTQAIPDPPRYRRWFLDGDLRTITYLRWVFNYKHTHMYQINITISQLVEKGYDQVMIRATLYDLPESISFSNIFDYTLFDMTFENITEVERYVREKMFYGLMKHSGADISAYYLDQDGYIYQREVVL